MAASEKVCGRPARQLAGACHSTSRSSQTTKEPRRRRAALRLNQFAVQ
jgi:hypothetical protein